MSIRKQTIILLLVALAILGAWDIYAFASGEDGATISEIIGESPPSIVFACGYLCGHFFWIRTVTETKKIATATVIKDETDED